MHDDSFGIGWIILWGMPGYLFVDQLGLVHKYETISPYALNVSFIFNICFYALIFPAIKGLRRYLRRRRQTEI